MHKWLQMSRLYTSGYKYQYFIQVVKNVNITYRWLKMSFFYTGGSKVKHSTLCASGYKSLNYAEVFERLNMSILYTSGQKVKHVTIVHKWFTLVVTNVQNNVDSPDV